MDSLIQSKAVKILTRSARRAQRKIFACMFFLTLAALACSPEQARADWQNYAPTSVSTIWPFDASSYLISQMGKIVLPTTQSNIGYIKIYPHDFVGPVATCPNATIALFPADFATSSVYYYPNFNPYFVGNMPGYEVVYSASYSGAKEITNDGGCAYRLYVNNVATTSATVAAGTYWYSVRSTSALQCDGGSSAKCLRLGGDAGGTGESQFYRNQGCAVSPCNDVQKKGSNGIGEATIAFLSATTSAPTPENPSSVIPEVVVCSTLDLGCYFQKAIVFAFYPSEASLDRFDSALSFASTTAPFAYAYELPALVAALFPEGTSTVSVTLPLDMGVASGTLTILSPAMIEAVPFADSLRTILGYVMYFMTALTMYALVIRSHNQNTHPV